MDKIKMMKEILEKRKEALKMLSEYDKGGEDVSNGDIVQHRSDKQNKQKDKP